jgi:hypothetical protein
MKKIYFLLFTFLITSFSFSQVVINEIDSDTPGTDTAEFIELKGTPNASLNGLVVVLFNGSNDLSYASFDLDGKTLDANGFFILANTALISGQDIDLGASNALQNGADAVAVYTGNDTDFPNGTAPTTTNLIDAIVYGTNDPDATGLLTGLGETVQYDESLNGASDSESLQLNVAGTAYETKAPTFRLDNNAAVCELSLTTTSATCDAYTVGTDTYTATVNFSGGGTSTYTVTADSGTLDLSAGDPSVDATGTITVTGVAEGTDVVISVVNGTLCQLESTIVSPVCEPANSLPLYEGFEYTDGETLNSQANWTGFNGGDEILVTSGSLSYPGLAASNGNSVSFVGSGMESKLEITPVTSGTVYSSFIFKITDQSAITDLTDGGYVAALAADDSSYNLRLWVHPNPDASGTTYDISISTLSSSPTFSSSTYNVGDNVFIVMSYETVTGNIKGWINPSSMDFEGSEPAADFTETASSPSPSIDRFILRQDSNGETPAITFDELRLGTTWSQVTPKTISVSEFDATAFTVYPNPTSTGFVNITSKTNDVIQVAVFDILGKQVLNNTLKNNKLNVTTLTSGVYIMKISQNGNTITKKLVVR